MHGLRLLFIVAVASALGACRSTGATPRPFPMPARAPHPPSAGPGDTATPGGAKSPGGTLAAPGTYALTGTALALRGAPYRNGGSDPTGFDCSGFTQYVFAQHGIALPREVKEQFDLGRPVTPEDILPGDLIFFSTVAPGASHVGIAIGGDEFVHAPSSTGVVRVERAGSSYWSQRFVAARRIVSK
jgi:cell wall-associated NlpC family hydrolase